VDGQILAAVTDNSLRVWDTATGEQLHTLKLHTGSVFVLECHPTDPRMAMSASYDGLTIIWDLEKGVPLAKCEPFHL
jgi:bromodomain and WD repeat domain-containing protein 1/3